MRWAVVAVTAAACVLVPTGASAGAAVPTPEVVPATGGAGEPIVPGFTRFDPAEVGYEQSEFFFSGTATAYERAQPAAADGKDMAVAVSSAPYTSRLVVMRPSDRRDFNGTVIVEWFNVSGGVDAGPDWTLAHNQMIREGFAYVGVSAQRLGLEALRSTAANPDAEAAGVRTADPERYAAIAHPGDQYAEDIFSQAGQAIRDDAAVILGGLRPKRVLAMGESQSAIRLTGYVNLVHPTAEVYDGFLIHSRFGGTPVRDDLDDPVLVFMTQGDTTFTSGGARQPDTDTFRLWEVAGTAHYDVYGLTIGPDDTGDGSAADDVLASMQDPPSKPIASFDCGAPINTGLATYVLNAAVHHLNRWVTDGTQPPEAPRLETVTTDPFVLDTHADGNALGGIRTPAVDAPIATLSGDSVGGASFCFLFGSTVPFSPEQIAERYPTHRAFVQAWTKATTSARAAGFLMPEDAKALIAAARRSDIGK